MVFKVDFNSISEISRHLVLLSIFSQSYPNTILFKPLAAFPHNHCRNNGQRWERNESCRNDYHQFSERILAEPGIEPATYFSKVRCATDWAIGHGIFVLPNNNLHRLILDDNLRKFMSECPFSRVASDLTYSLIHHFETAPNSRKLQTTTEMWQLKDFKIQTA